MTSFPQKLTKFFSFVDISFIHSHFSFGRTWISKLRSFNKWGMGNLQIHLWRHAIMTSQCRNKNVTKIVKNYVFEWLSPPITFVIFIIEPWYYYWRKCMHIKRSCMNLVYFEPHFCTLNYTENITPILQYLLHFSVLLVIQDRVYFNNYICCQNPLFFQIQKIFEVLQRWKSYDVILMMSYVSE